MYKLIESMEQFAFYVMAIVLMFFVVLYLLSVIASLKSDLKLMTVAKDGFFNDFCQKSNDCAFYERESIELNRSYKSYMDSVEVMVRQHAQDLGESIDACKELREKLAAYESMVKDWQEKVPVEVDFSLESKINTVLEQ